jgi:glycosyltransferase involved in cell wall biosynthesis
MAITSRNAPGGSQEVTRRSLLAVFPIAPWPVRASGISIRYYQLLKHLASRHDVDMVVLGDFRDTLPDDPLLHECRKVTVCHYNRRSSPGLWRRLKTFASIVAPGGTPYAYANYYSGDVCTFLRKLTIDRQYDTLLWSSWFLRDALDSLRKHIPDTRIVSDTVDSPFLHYQRELALAAKISLAQRYDLWKTKKWEQRLPDGVDASVYISPIDAKAAFDGKLSRSVVIPNGVFTDDYQLPEALTRAPVIGYLGHMGYRPNIDAALHLHQEVFLPLKEHIPDLRLIIIGRGPTDQLRRLANESVIVTGEVQNIWEHIHKVRVFVFPMTSGAGLQNKVLEVMYAGKPVVTTDICMNSVGAQNGIELFAANDSKEIQDYTQALLTDDALATRIGSAGQAFVRQHFEISHVVDTYENLLFPSTQE